MAVDRELLSRRTFPVESDSNLTKAEIVPISIPIGGIDEPGRRPGEERLRLFDVSENHNLGASPRHGRICLFESLVTH
jgi:hypothetical protein